MKNKLNISDTLLSTNVGVLTCKSVMREPLLEIPSTRLFIAYRSRKTVLPGPSCPGKVSNIFSQQTRVDFVNFDLGGNVLESAITCLELKAR